MKRNFSNKEELVPTFSILLTRTSLFLEWTRDGNNEYGRSFGRNESDTSIKCLGKKEGKFSAESSNDFKRRDRERLSSRGNGKMEWRRRQPAFSSITCRIRCARATRTHEFRPFHSRENYPPTLFSPTFIPFLIAL